MAIELLATVLAVILWVLAFNFWKKHPAAAKRSVALFGLAAFVSLATAYLWFLALR
jgi:hypothetical protein